VPFTHRGKYWQYHNVIVEPPTAQRPHPPFWMGAGSERSVRQVADRGYNLLLGQYDRPGDVLHHVAQFRRDVEARGRRFDPMEVGVARAVHFADTKEELEAAYVRRFQGHVRINKLAEKPGGDDRERFAREDESEIRALCDETAIFGTADQIGQKLEALRNGGVEYVIVNFGGSIKNIRRFAREIMPYLSGEPRLADAAK
jgi:alkanesulfonate monooxygenase SsuD/methylene tetrahydromethanopterin reductase-like flavin-dependent oxidoreductase (luciferase family)